MMKRVPKKSRRTKNHSHSHLLFNTIKKEEQIFEDDLFYDQSASDSAEKISTQPETNPDSDAEQKLEIRADADSKPVSDIETETNVESEQEKAAPVKMSRTEKKTGSSAKKKKKKKQPQKQKREPRSFGEWLADARYTMNEWSHSPIFTTFAGRFTLISLLACSCFALVLTVTLAGCHQNFELTNQTFVTELGTDVYANPSLYINDPETIDVSKLTVEPKSPGITILENRFVSVSLDYLGVGTYDFVMKEGRNETPFVIKVKDTKPPTLKASPSQITVDWGKQPDWDEIYGGTDLSGVYYEPNMSIWTEVGEHDIEVKIRDRFGNSLIRSLKVTVNS